MKNKKTIKFREELKDDKFYTTLKEQVTNYLEEHNYNGYATKAVYIKGAFYSLSLIYLYFYLIFSELTYPKILFVWAAVGVSGILLGLNISHDAAHKSLFRNATANKVIHYIIFNLLGANAYLWQLRHVESHHLFPNVDNCDADIDDNQIIRLSIFKEVSWYHKFQWIYAPFLYLFYTLHWTFYKDFIILDKKQLANLENIKHPTSEIILFYIAKVIYLFIFIGIPILFTNFTWIEVMVGFLVMHFASSSLFIFGLIPSHFSDLTIFSRVDDNGYLEYSWAGHQIASSLDYHAEEKWANFVFGGFNAHVAHHLFPNISHIHYPKISKFIAVLAPEYKINYKNVSWFEAINSHFRFLKKLGQN